MNVDTVERECPSEIVAALGDLVFRSFGSKSEAASAVSDVDEVLRQLDQSHTHVSVTASLR
jgi:hypothetical protein